MGIITPDNNNVFKSASFIFSKVKRDLSSFADANLIDEGEFPTYVKEVLRFLGIGVYKEADAVINVKNYRGKLPSDFTQVYAAYKCTRYINPEETYQQGAPISVYNDVTWELLQAQEGTEIQVTEDSTQVIESITVRQHVKQQAFTYGFKDPVLLRLSPNVKKDKCAEDCANMFSDSMYEFSIVDGFIYTNFSKDSVYMKYYAFPKDEDGIPMVLDNERLEKCIEWYIKYQLMLTWWTNNTVPDMQHRWQKAEIEYQKWLGETKYWTKTPSFTQMVNTIRRNRAVNKINIFAR